MEDKHDTNITILIRTPQKPWEHEFKSTTTIKQVIEDIVKHFSFAPNGTYELRLKTDEDNPLEPDKTLENYGIKDGAIVIFTDLGVAV